MTLRGSEKSAGFLGKRAIDLALSVLMLAAALPVLLVISAAIKISSRGPILYRGKRIGLHSREFEMLKFRSMVVDADRIGASSTKVDDARVTPLGRQLRRYKLDELPQLINVLRGDMSLVGPRPQVPWAVAMYTAEERILLTVRPGITDPASLRFANEGEILRGHPDPDRGYYELIHAEKMRLSIDYVKHRTFVGDMQIIASTVGAVFGRRPGGSRVPEESKSTT